MCGIVGYVGTASSKSFVLNGLKRLEYRGYDSAGFACLDPASHIVLHKKSVGYLKNLEEILIDEPIDGPIGIGHIRWATHGGITEQNAHPHTDCHKKIALVHNGIIENHQLLKKHLHEQNHILCSQTDTETIAHLIEEAPGNSLKEKISYAVSQLKGAFALLIVHKDWPTTLVAVRKGSPLCIGVDNNHQCVASDVLAFAGITDQVLFLPDESFALITKGKYSIFDFAGNELLLKPVVMDIAWNEETHGYKHHMLKEIYEQKTAIRKTVSSYQAFEKNSWKQLGVDVDFIKQLKSLHLIGCGTSWHAARIGQFFFETIAQIPTRVVLASEFRYSTFFPEVNSLYIGISQSGETADTLESIRLVNSYNLPTVAISNVATSTLIRETKGCLLTYAGHEISVASTKAFSTQLVALYWLAHQIAYARGLISEDMLKNSFEDIVYASEILENTIERYKVDIENSYAPYYAQFKRFIFLGRHISYPFAMEAALKLKEISYIFSQCYPAGELKHGPIALLDAETPVVIFSSTDELIYQKILSNAQEVKARNAHLLAFSFEGQEELQQIANYSFIIPKVKPLLGPLAMTGLMQFWVYHIADVLGCPIDKPRNLAKSVTVE